MLTCLSVGFINSNCAQRYCYQLGSHLGIPSGNGLGAVQGYDQIEQLFTYRKIHFCFHRNFRIFYLNGKRPQWKPPDISV